MISVIYDSRWIKIKRIIKKNVTYIYPHLTRCDIKPSNKLKILPGDLLNAVEYRRCDNFADFWLKKIVNRSWRYQIINKIQTKTSQEDFVFLIQHALINKIVLILRAFHCADQAAKLYKLEKIRLYPGRISYFLYKKLDQMHALPKYISISKWHLAKCFFYEIANCLYFFVKTALFPEKILLAMRGKARIQQKKYKIGLAIQDGFDFFMKNHPDLREKAICVLDEENHILPSYVDKKKYFVVNFNTDLLKNYSRLRYIKKIYYSWVLLRFKILLTISFAPELSALLYKTFRSLILWHLFYDQYKVEKFIKTMAVGDMTAHLVHRQFNVETIFIYLSVTGATFIKDYPNNVDCVDYAYAIFDTLIGNKISNQWLREQNIKTPNMLDIGVLNADFILSNKKNKLKFRHQFNISEPYKIISVFDHTVGNAGVFSETTYRLFVDCIQNIIDSQENCIIFLKTKKKLAVTQEFIPDILSHPRVLYANDLNLTVFELMAFSDIVISAPVSSILGFSLAAQINTICFDPKGVYQSSDWYANQFPEIYVTDQQALTHILLPMLADEMDFHLNQNIEANVNLHLDAYADGKAIERLRAYLC